MTSKTIANEDRVASTIHIINNLVRGITQKRQVKKVDTDYFVLNGNTVETVIDMIKNRAAKSAIVVDDIGLQIINRLVQEGVKDITLVIARLPESCMNVVKYILTKTFPDIKVNIKHIEEILNMDEIETELVISNPPYGAIGANITKKIIDTVKFIDYINLLPANDYKRNTGKDLFNYQSNMEAINDGFVDAAVTTHVAKVHKTKVNNMTLDEFERTQYIDQILDKYFKCQELRKHSAIDNEERGSDRGNTNWVSSNTFIIGWRDINHRHLPYDKTALSFAWNNSNTMHSDSLKTGRDSRIMFYGIIFSTNLEKENFVNFAYSANGFRFFSKLFKAMNKDGWVSCRYWMPKVDWTRSWTVEEILADYGYTEDEIKAVMDDLKNFKGMDD